MKDKEYDKHVHAQGRDRDKKFGGSMSAITESRRYVIAWCKANGLVHEQPRRRRARAGR